MSPLVARPISAELSLREERLERAQTPAPSAVRSRLLEPAAIFAIAYAVYAAFGIWSALGLQVVLGDAEARLEHAFSVFWNDPSKLAAIGFYWPPLQTLVLLPMAAVKPLATSLVALPLTSALFGAGLLVVLDRALTTLELDRALRWVLVAAFGLNPMIFFYAVNGMAEILYLFFLTLAMALFVRWASTPRWHDLPLVGFAFAFGVLSRYEVGAWLPLVLVAVVAVLMTRRVAVPQIEAALLAIVVPVGYALLLWTFLTWEILGDPLAWFKALFPRSAGTTAATPEPLGGLILDALQIHLTLFAPAVAVAALVLVVAVRRRNIVGLALGAGLLLNLATTLFILVRSQSTTFLELRYNMRGMPLVLLALGWLLMTVAPARRRIAGLAAVAAIVLAIPATAWTMLTSDHVGAERVFLRALLYGETVGYVDEQRTVAEFIRERVPGRDRVLTDDAQTFGIALLDGHPERYVDRIDVGDDVWLRIRDHPIGRVDYFLVRRDPSGSDLIAQRYPGLNDPSHPLPSFTRAVFEHGRYVLYAIDWQRPPHGR